MPYNVRLKYSGSHPVVTLGQLKREIPADRSQNRWVFGVFENKSQSDIDD